MAAPVEGWLTSALLDADRRGLPALKPLLEGLARSTASLRAAAVEDAKETDARARPEPPAGSGS
jgi:hypothetical protein